MAAKITFPTQWELIDPDASGPFEDEYAIEIAKGHPLYGVPVKAIARRKDCDDVLFRLLRHLCEYTVVHLTWSGKEESDTKWPSFALYADDDDLVEMCFKRLDRETKE
jgi:hypothetical protein